MVFPLKIVALLLLVEFHLSLCDTEFVSPSKVFQEIEKGLFGNRWPPANEP